MEKKALFVFNGDPMCFIHVLLNALDFKEKGYDATIVVEGAAVKLLPELVKPENPLSGLWEKVKKAGLVKGACRACSKKLGTADAAEAQGLPLIEGVAGHPSMADFINDGFDIITF